MYFHQYLHWVQETKELSRKAMYEGLQIDESTLSYWFTASRRPQTKTIAKVVNYFHHEHKERMKALEIIFYGLS